MDHWSWKKGLKTAMAPQSTVHHVDREPVLLVLRAPTQHCCP